MHLLARYGNLTFDCVASVTRVFPGDVDEEPLGCDFPVRSRGFMLVVVALLGKVGRPIRARRCSLERFATVSGAKTVVHDKLSR